MGFFHWGIKVADHFEIKALTVLMGAVDWALELIGIYVESKKKKQYTNNTQ